MDMEFEAEEAFVWDPNNYYTPIAFVIQTQVEHHDIFKQIMMLLYQHLYKPEINRNLVFADFLAHIAFIASLPCPSFNTQFEIEFLNRKITINEPMYD